MTTTTQHTAASLAAIHSRNPRELDALAAQQPQRQKQRGRVWPSRAAHDDLFMPRKPRFGERFGDLRHTRHASQSSPQRALVRWVYCGQLCAHCR